MRKVHVGMLGSGFIGEFHTLGLRYVPDARVVANWGAGSERREAFGRRFDSRPLDSIEAVCADPEVDLVVVSLPNHLHLEAVRAAAANGKAVACTKPLGRNATEAARYLFGKDAAVRDVFAWGDTLVHRERTTLEDNAVMLVRFEDGRVATMDVSWSSKGGLENRFEVYGDGGRIVQDITSTVLRAFIERPAGYLGEKVDADTGWVYPVPNETYVHGHDAMMADVVEAFRGGHPPRETFADGLVVNTILDAAYRSMKSGRWEAVERHAAAVPA